MQGFGLPLVGNPPTGPLPGGSQVTSIGRCPPAASGTTCLNAASTLPCSRIGEPASGQCGVFENVSASDAQVSNTTGEACVRETGAANCVSSRQMNASECSLTPSTAPPLAGSATTTGLCA